MDCPSHSLGTVSMLKFVSTNGFCLLNLGFVVNEDCSIVFL